MTDTPRTKDELLSIFATNDTGAISSQDMRDFLVSMAAYGGHALTFSIYNGGANLVTAANDTWTQLPFNANAPNFTMYSGETNVDINPTGSYVSTFQGFTYSDEQYLRLPAGIWRWVVYVFWESNPVGLRRCFFYTGDDRISESVDPTFTAPAYAADILLLPVDAYDMPAPGPAYQAIAGETYVTQAMIEANGSHSDAGNGWVMAPYVKQTSGGSLGITSISCNLVRIGFA